MAAQQKLWWTSHPLVLMVWTFPFGGDEVVQKEVEIRKEKGEGMRAKTLDSVIVRMIMRLVLSKGKRKYILVAET